MTELEKMIEQVEESQFELAILADKVFEVIEKAKEDESTKEQLIENIENCFDVE